MKIEKIELRNIHMSLVSPFETSFGVQNSRDVLLIAVHADGLIGRGECVAGEDPFYSPETPVTCKYILKEYLIPALFEGTISGDPKAFFSESGFVREHNMARSTMEAALWDLEAQRKQQPLHALFGGTREELYTGVSVGIQPSLAHLVDVVGKYIDDGYRRIKIKIKPGWDVDPVAEIKKAYPDVPLMVDANCAYSIDQIDTLIALDQFDLMMIEQPFSYTDLLDHATLQSEINTPVCLDESAKNLGILKAALEMNACKLVNIKQGRVGGPSQAIEIHDLCKENGIGVWAGGMLETGIGRALNIALATLDNFTIPGDISASNRYWHKDIIQPEVEVSKDGTLGVPSGSGLGFDIDQQYIEKITTGVEHFRP